MVWRLISDSDSDFCGESSLVYCRKVGSVVRTVWYSAVHTACQQSTEKQCAAKIYEMPPIV